MFGRPLPPRVTSTGVGVRPEGSFLLTDGSRLRSNVFR